ncbi:hypothetical protein [Aquabacter spiritensis]|uniref:Uncharacterized protein n=1 Tax=Aquabacter spiritensis TaxID=933073 RepID=A0A4R3M356_9HYPH|nr:hypothetical protein [Aquabacter spiritensis]TCT07600.1 hypothetical protein EDC64_101119 [Aquabacter spiritensis]
MVVEIEAMKGSQDFAGRTLRKTVARFGSLLSLSAPHRLEFARPRSAADALHQDWQRLGADMRRAVEVVTREKARAKR